MGQTREQLTPHVAERVCWHVARRDETRVARRLYRQPRVDGVYRLDDGARLDDCFHCLPASGVRGLLAQGDGAAIERERGPFVPYVLRQGVKTLFGIERRHALPALLCRDAALMRLVGCKAPQVRDGVCQRGAAKRQQARAPTPIGPDTLANQMVQCHVRALAAVCKGVMRALAKAGIFGTRVTGRADGPEVETTERQADGGQATRKVRIEDKRGQVHERAVTVYGWKGLILMDAAPKIPLAVKVGKSAAHATHGTRALVTQARAHLAGGAHRHQGVVEKGLLAGSDRWGLDQQGSRFVVPAKAHLAVTAEARAPAAAGEGMTPGRRVPTGRHGQGQAARADRIETEVGGLTGLTTYDPQGTGEPGRHHNRRAFQPHRIHAVVIRPWHGRDQGPGGTTVFLTNASVQPPWRPFDDDDDRRRIEHGGIKEATHQWNLGHPPPKTERAVRGQVMFTRLMCALATASRLPCERDDRDGEPVGWQRWRRQLLEDTRDPVLVCAQGYSGLFHLAEYSLGVGGKLQEVPPGLGTRQDVLATYRLTTRG